MCDVDRVWRGQSHRNTPPGKRGCEVTLVPSTPTLRSPPDPTHTDHDLLCHCRASMRAPPLRPLASPSITAHHTTPAPPPPTLVWLAVVPVGAGGGQGHAVGLAGAVEQLLAGDVVGVHALLRNRCKEGGVVIGGGGGWGRIGVGRDCESREVCVAEGDAPRRRSTPVANAPARSQPSPRGGGVPRALTGTSSSSNTTLWG